jgi:hypothetical protein
MRRPRLEAQGVPRAAWALQEDDMENDRSPRVCGRPSRERRDCSAQNRSSTITYGDRYSTSSSSQSRWDYRGGFGSSYGGTYTGDRSGGMSFGGM